MAVTKVPKGISLAGVEVEPDTYDAPADLSSDEEYMVVEEADSKAARLKKSGLKGIENIKAAFTRESMTKTKDNIGTKFNHLGERIVPPERREKIHQAGERLKQSSEKLKDNIAKKAPTKESFRIKLKKERTVAEGQEGAEGIDEGAEDAEQPAGEPKKSSSDVTYTEVVTEIKQEAPGEEPVAARIGEALDEGRGDGQGPGNWSNLPKQAAHLHEQNRKALIGTECAVHWKRGVQFCSRSHQFIFFYKRNTELLRPSQGYRFVGDFFECGCYGGLVRGWRQSPVSLEGHREIWSWGNRRVCHFLFDRMQ